MIAQRGRESGDMFVYALFVIVLVGGIALLAWQAVQGHRQQASVSNQGQSQQEPASSSSEPPSTQLDSPLTSGTSDQNLTSDLGNLDSSLQQGGQNLDSANAALNDQQQPVSEE